jgi:hypothetical protein
MNSMDTVNHAFPLLLIAVFMAAIAISCLCFPDLAAQMNGTYSAKDYRSMGKWLIVGSVLAAILGAVIFLVSLAA